MTLRELPSRLNLIQRERAFKIIASIVVVALSVGLFATLAVIANRPGAEAKIAEAAAKVSTAPKGMSFIDAGPVGFVRDSIRTALFLLASKGGWMGVATVFGLVTGLILGVIWMGLGLSYFGLLLAGWLVAWPLASFEATRGLGQLLMGIVPLTLIFLTLMQLLRSLFGFSTPTFAIARNLLNEAVRMKVSLVFIVVLLLFLAAVPGMLNDTQPLRYRVQQWLSYGTGLSYGVLALLTVFLSVGTVAFEQRDRVIWQTMTKPVAGWRYVLGKWLGVMGLNAVLLGVTAGGVFLFTEFLRHQPARGEMAFHTLQSGQVTLGNPAAMSEDRRILENQVLVARVGARPEPFTLTPERIDRMAKRQAQTSDDPGVVEADLRREMAEEWATRLNEAIERRIMDMQSNNPQFVPTESDRRRLQRETIDQWEFAYRTIQPGSGREFEFDLSRIQKRWQGLQKRYGSMIEREIDRRITERSIQVPQEDEARAQMREMIAAEVIFDWQAAGRLPSIPDLSLRFKVNSGTNDPTALYSVVFILGNGQMFERQVALKAAQTISIPIDAVGEDGMLTLGIFSQPTNPDPFTFPPDGLEVMYPAGGYQLNFVRVFLVMWVKLGFIAAVAIAAGTFLSFAVACLVSLCILFAAESASFLNEALRDYYFSTDQEGNIDYIAVVVRAVAIPVAWIFRLYSELQPSARLVDGRLISWGELAKAIGILGLWTVGALGCGWLIFRQRELALYSGH